MSLSIGPSARAWAAFDLGGRSARLLTGGQGRAWRVGEVVLKPVDDVAEAAWTADVLSVLVEDGFRITRPVRSSAGEWVVDGWSAWEALPGEHVLAGRWSDVMHVAQKLNEALIGLPRPGFLDRRTHAWAVADRMVWCEDPVTVVHQVLRPVAERLTALLRPENGDSQVIHGDLTGNVLFAPGRPPGVVDFTPYWRPARFCLAIVAVDAVLWHDAPTLPRDAVPATDDGTSLLARAALRRLITSDRLAGGRDSSTRDDHLRTTALDHERVLRLLGERSA